MRPILVVGAVVNLCGVGIWIASIFVPIPNRFALLWMAISLGTMGFIMILIIDWFGYLGVVIILRLSPFVSQRLAKILKNTFAYYPGTPFLIVFPHGKPSTSSITLIE